MATPETMSRAEIAFIDGFERLMNSFSRFIGTEQETEVTAQDLKDSFNYLRTIDPTGAEELLQCFCHCANDPNSNAVCPSELPASYRRSFKARTEVAIRGAEEKFNL